jgi:hypothetical protein
MGQKRIWLGTCGVALVGAAVTLVPVGLAGASASALGASAKGSDPGSPLCTFIRGEEKGSDSAGSALAKGLVAGNASSAKEALTKAFGAVGTDIQKAESQSFVKSAPANVRAAFKGLAAGVNKLKTALTHANGITSLETSFSAIGANPAFVKDNTTVTKWATGICGSAIIKSTTVGSSNGTP